MVSGTENSMSRWSLDIVASYPRLRALAWAGDVLYASRGYSLLSTTVGARPIAWREVARYKPPWWRNLTASTSLTFRLVRDGFHALTRLSSGAMVAAVPGAIVTLPPGGTEFQATHKILRGTRPLHICAVPDGTVYFGEYFDNAERDEVHIYASMDHGMTWQVAHTFPESAIRHVHNIVYDRWANCLWILTGDNGDECRVLRASCDLKNIETVLTGNQQARAVAAVPTAEGLYFPSDTPSEANHLYCLDRRQKLHVLADIPSSSIYGCRVSDALFFSTMVEPSEVNHEDSSWLYGSLGGATWTRQLSWKKDRWPFGLFQYGNALLPDGENSTGFLAVSTVAVTPGDLETSVWRVVR
jgi:hypothetical protein